MPTVTKAEACTVAHLAAMTSIENSLQQKKYYYGITTMSTV
jgi:hypothetical protein